MKVYVSTRGKETGNGSKQNPYLSIEKAQEKVREYAGREAVEVQVETGIYTLSKPLVFTAEDSGSPEFPVTYIGMGNVVLSGGTKLDLCWEEQKDGIYAAKTPSNLIFDRLFVNGKLQHMARYPSYDPKARYFNGYAADSFAPERVRNYRNPKGGYMHVMHEGLWGDFHYEITGMDQNGNLQYWGGHQNNRPAPMHPYLRYIENIREELTEPGEWYLDRDQWILYYKPTAGLDLQNCEIYGAVLKNLIHFQGRKDQPVHDIRLQNMELRHTGRTFMEPMEPLLRSDWCCCRLGSVLLENTERITISSCDLLEAGGNGVVLSRYNRDCRVSHCLIRKAGASGVLVVGDPSAVRAPLFRYEENYEGGLTPDEGHGPKGKAYPQDCYIEDNLIVACGTVEKQSAGVGISMARRITVSNNTIYDVPRAGINICDGTWGGHQIVKNMVFNTVLETNDHGAFNSWGRDRFWDSEYAVMAETLKNHPDLPLRDTVEPIVLRGNCFECAHGWDIDLDDGSSNYEISGNLCLQGGIKNREGIRRTVCQNILLNNTLHPHLWFENSEDRFFQNLIFYPYADIRVNGWGTEMDYNLLYSKTKRGPAVDLQKKSGQDSHSFYSCITFENPEDGCFKVQETKELEAIGFEQINTTSMGVQSPRLKAMAKSPFDGHNWIKDMEGRSTPVVELHGIELKKLSGLGELSATGMYREVGIYVKSVHPSAFAGGLQLQANDVLLAIDQVEIDDPLEASRLLQQHPKQLWVWRNQRKITLFPVED